MPTLWFQRILDLPNGHAILTAWVIWVVASITLHELAHGWMAVRRGDPTPIDTGHMTLNPIVHMGVPSLIIFALTGIAWGLMPIDPTRLRGRYAEALVALAGPLMNFFLAAICILSGGLWDGFAGPSQNTPSPVGDKTHEQILLFLRTGALLNLALGLFNLLPAPPLDGSRILANLWPAYRRLLQTEAGGFLSAVAFILAFLAGAPIFAVGAIIADLSIGIISAIILAFRP